MTDPKKPDLLTAGLVLMNLVDFTHRGKCAHPSKPCDCGHAAAVQDFADAVAAEEARQILSNYPTMKPDLLKAAEEVWASIPATYDETDPSVQRHAQALRSLGVAIATTDQQLLVELEERRK